MEPRLVYREEDPSCMQAMAQLEKYVRQTGLDRILVELVKIRASQINGCAFCLDMHTQDARVLGETEQRIYCLGAWREAPFYTDAERAAIELTEAVTRISEGGVPDDLYRRVRQHFDGRQYVQLIMVINTINAWNRLSIATRTLAGTYHADAGRSAVAEQSAATQDRRLD